MTYREENLCNETRCDKSIDRYSGGGSKWGKKVVYIVKMKVGRWGDIIYMRHEGQSTVEDNTHTSNTRRRYNNRVINA